MTSKTTRRVYPDVQPPIEIVVHDPIMCYFQDEVSRVAETKFAQEINDFAQALTLSFAELPTTIQDLKEPDEPVHELFVHNELSLAEMGLSDYKASKKSTKVTPIKEQAYLPQV
jgi:hypothetical protein